MYPHRFNRLEKAVHEKLQDKNSIAAENFLGSIERLKQIKKYEDDLMLADGDMNSNVLGNKPDFHQIKESTLNEIASLDNPRLYEKAKKCIDKYLPKNSES